MPGISKVKSLNELADLLAELRTTDGDKPPVVVHCHGVFDLLHIGHIRYLQKARELGDLLIVTATPDRHVNKGPHRPAFNEKHRLDSLAALDCVDYVAVNEWPTAAETLRLLKPDIYAKGAEFRDHGTPELRGEEAVVQELGGRVEFIDEVRSSSSHLINQYLSQFDETTDEYLRDFRSRHSLSEVIDWVEKARGLRILVVGEAIIDEYYSCSAIGQSAKAPILAARYESHERFAGGAMAVANHLASFCDGVDLLSMIGDMGSEETWLRSQLNTNVHADFVTKGNSPTIVKRRYLESYFQLPMFAINFLNDDPLSATEQSDACRRLKDVDQYDVVIVTDYGHQMMAPGVIETLGNGAKFLAVNTQSNAANKGFHTISKYSRADYVSLSELELQLECRSRNGELSQMLMDVGQRLYASTIAVTLGKLGCLCYNRRAGFHQAPALATKVVDRVGAGDAFFGFTSLYAALDAPLEILAFLGNVAGAEAVAVVGNKQTMDSLLLKRHIESLFK
ncbi:MAG: PfkB family carbohydrate kinase [Pirellulaceae bacterium]|jgi:rfaE bifunctional protein nucleotidyltransferase chain/domain|nr:PfkB family carbohydrate kinase [Pirellulaceae bacterium]MDP6556756.1 PfkB family carbohydrate kinase [Pirellulaceae bacterium]